MRIYRKTGKPSYQKARPQRSPPPLPWPPPASPALPPSVASEELKKKYINKKKQRNINFFFKDIRILEFDKITRSSGKREKVRAAEVGPQEMGSAKEAGQRG